MARPEAVLIAAVSGRALAACARRAGYRPLVADCFGDQDTRALADGHVRLTADLRRGIDADELMDGLECLAKSNDPLGIVCGTGFEDRPGLLIALSRRWRLLGNAAGTVARAKDPLQFARLCRDCSVPHPQTLCDPPSDPVGWLAKRRGGAGGTHIRNADDARDPGGVTYYQRCVTGRPVSALVIGDGRTAATLGFSAQWSLPTDAHPFRYGGAVRPAALAPGLATALADAVLRLAAALPLVGLNSVDFVIDDEAFWLLEVNPRPGATLDIFEPANGSLFAWHLAACEGSLPAEPPALPEAMAQSIVYADRDIGSMPAVDWPDWTADRQSAQTSVKAGQPLCTVVASASTSRAAEDLVRRRNAVILRYVEARSS